MFRPRINDSLEERIADEAERRGFDSNADFVRYCVHRELGEPEDAEQA